MPGKTIATIDRECRDALYELVLDHLSGIGDFWIAVEEKDFARTERLGIEFGEDFRLLEDIGWGPGHRSANVDLTMQPHDLIELLRRLHGEAESVLEGSACAPPGEGRGERQAALPASQEHLQGADRATRSPHRHFPRKLKLADVSTYVLARFMDWLADEEEQGERLSDRTSANAVIPRRAALATAKREGLIRHNPAQGFAVTHREQLPDEEVKVFSRDQLAAILAMRPERHRPLFELLAATGLRISEAIALQRLRLPFAVSRESFQNINPFPIKWIG